MLDEPPTDIVDRYPPAVVIEVDDDHCDACGTARVQARLYAKLPDGRTLAFCKHHGDQHFEALIEKGAKIADHRHWDDET
jgi:hypothetical protein